MRVSGAPARTLVQGAMMGRQRYVDLLVARDRGPEGLLQGLEDRRRYEEVRRALRGLTSMERDVLERRCGWRAA
jgi:hypothetical protein